VEVILADVSDYGVDLAAGKIFASYQPGAQRWEQLQYPNGRWLTCKTEATVDQPSQTVHINLLDGALRVNGQLLGGLPRDIREIFRDVCTCFTSYVNECSQLSFTARLPCHTIKSPRNGFHDPPYDVRPQGKYQRRSMIMVMMV
jgi:hypothetical protein